MTKILQQHLEACKSNAHYTGYDQGCVICTPFVAAKPIHPADSTKAPKVTVTSLFDMIMVFSHSHIRLLLLSTAFLNDSN